MNFDFDASRASWLACILKSLETESMGAAWRFVLLVLVFMLTRIAGEGSPNNRANYPRGEG